MRKILIIDDEIDLCRLLKDFFSERGYQVIYALTGRGGLDAFESEKPHIVMLDLRLKDIEGTEVLRKMRATKDPCKIIILTGSAREEDKIKAMKLGANYYIKKPFSLKRLTKLLKIVI